LISFLAVVLPAMAADQEAAASNITFNRDIAPIIYRNCSPCHRPGGSPP